MKQEMIDLREYIQTLVSRWESAVTDAEEGAAIEDSASPRGYAREGQAYEDMESIRGTFRSTRWVGKVSASEIDAACAAILAAVGALTPTYTIKTRCAGSHSVWAYGPSYVSLDAARKAWDADPDLRQCRCGASNPRP